MHSALWRRGLAGTSAKLVCGASTEHVLGWFLEEQCEEVASMHALLAVIDRAGADHMLLVEDYLIRSGGLTAD